MRLFNREGEGVMERYKDNGLCEFLKEKYQNNEKSSDIKFFDTDKSLLIVADKKTSIPLCMIIDDRVENDTDPGTLSESEMYHGNICYRIAKQAGLPLFWIRYVDCEILRNDDHVYLWDSANMEGRFQKIRLRQMTDILGRYEINAWLENRTPQKRKNDSLSSAFHIWQRECLHVGIFADIDLIRMRGDRVIELIELKRSYIHFDSWNPYNNDINNFSILSNFCQKLGNVDFHIVFNAQLRWLPRDLTKEERGYYRAIEKKGEVYYDKIDVLKLYRVEHRENVYFYPLPYPVLLGIIRLEDYLDYERYRAFLGAAK